MRLLRLQAGPNPFGQGGAQGGFGGVDLGDILGGMFGRGGGRARPQQVQGRDLETEVSLSFDQAVNGAQVSVTVPKEERCQTCHGSGAKPGTSPVTCPRCEGSGIDAQSQGIFSISRPCPQCGGAGQIIEDPVPDLRGVRPDPADEALQGQHPRRGQERDPDPARRQGRGRAPRRPPRRPLRDDPGRDLARLQAARRRQPRGDGADHRHRGPARGDDRGADPERHQEDQGAARHHPRHRPEAAGRGAAEAERERQRRDPLPARDRGAQGAQRGAGGGRREARRGDERLGPRADLLRKAAR